MWPLQRTYQLEGVTTVHVSFIIPIHNQLDLLQRCITSILLTAAKVDYTIVLVDDGSTDPQIQTYCQRLVKCSNHSQIIYLHTATEGFSAAYNWGMVESPNRTTHYVLINTDIEIGTPDWTSSLRSLSDMPDIGLFGPISNNARAQSIPLLQGGGLPKGETVYSFTKLVATLTEHRRPPIYLIHDFCYIVRKDVIDDIGYLNKDVFPHYGAKDDLSLRAVNAGWRGVILDDVFVYRVSSKPRDPRNPSGLVATASRTLTDKYGEDYVGNLRAQGQAGLNYLRGAMVMHYRQLWGMPRRVQ